MLSWSLRKEEAPPQAAVQHYERYSDAKHGSFWTPSFTPFSRRSWEAPIVPWFDRLLESGSPPKLASDPNAPLPVLALLAPYAPTEVAKNPTLLLSILHRSEDLGRAWGMDRAPVEPWHVAAYEGLNRLACEPDLPEGVLHAFAHSEAPGLVLSTLANPKLPHRLREPIVTRLSTDTSWFFEFRTLLEDEPGFAERVRPHLPDAVIQAWWDRLDDSKHPGIAWTLLADQFRFGSRELHLHLAQTFDLERHPFKPMLIPSHLHVHEDAARIFHERFTKRASLIGLDPDGKHPLTLLLRFRSTPSDVLHDLSDEVLAHDPTALTDDELDAFSRLSVELALHPNTPPEDAARLTPLVREAGREASLLTRSDFPSSPGLRILEALLRREHLNPEPLPEWAARHIVKTMPKNHSIHHRAFENPRLHPGVSDLEDHEERLAILTTLLELPAREAERLATSPHPEERAQVARLTNDPNLLERLAHDKHPQVRRKAAASIHASATILVQLARDADDETRREANEHIKLHSQLHLLKYF